MKTVVFFIYLVGWVTLVRAQWITEIESSATFPLVTPGSVVVIYVDTADHFLVQKSASLLQQDIERVTGIKPSLVNTPTASHNMIIIGSIERCSLVQQLIKDHKIESSHIQNHWEAYQAEAVKNPLKGIDNALVITGSDRRGTAYGVFELSKQIGVSPWYWWADVPVKKKPGLYVNRNLFIYDAPKVKYRGIFINDESPAFSGWAKEKFGGINHLVYEKVFELLLRLKANYLWPAMWGNAFNDDDTLNPVIADQYGIVMGTSHHEPMLRSQQEWKRYGNGQWNYDSNEVTLKQFWKKGIGNMGSRESIVTVGMSGDGDKPMAEETATALLERIVGDQRTIIEEVTGKPAAQTPQLWALYKEVQDYYDKGMRVPDDVTLLLCDDNWGNIRKLPKLTDHPRTGGYGIYYHFDYVGGPRNYKWVNTNPIPRVWEQMHLAYEYNVRNIWIVNVGDLKPMEFPISFFLDYAWNPERITQDDLQAYTQQWSSAQFGNKFAAEIADIISKYSKYNSRRKPELLDAGTYHLYNEADDLSYNEAEMVMADYRELLQRAVAINRDLPPEYRDAFFELVLHPVKACANLQALYTAVANNRNAFSYRWAIANDYAEKAKQLYVNDSLISVGYHTIVAGKWNHMMDQTHIGYTYWQQPAQQQMPRVNYVRTDSIIAQYKEVRAAPPTAVSLIPKNSTGNIFYEMAGFVSIAADHYTKAVNSNGCSWKVLPDHGRTGSAVTTFPVNSAAQDPGRNAPYLEYQMYVYDTGIVRVQAYFSPTLNFHNDDGLKYAISIDNEEPQVISINKDDKNIKAWEGWVANNIIIKTTQHSITKAGKHVIKYRMVSPAVVLQKLIVNFGERQPYYLGPPETLNKNTNSSY